MAINTAKSGPKITPINEGLLSKNGDHDSLGLEVLSRLRNGKHSVRSTITSAFAVSDVENSPPTM
jgi:hypothetical protein